MIKYNGFQVAPSELEGASLLTVCVESHPAVLENAVVGRPDKSSSVENELPWAFVVPVDGNLSDERTPELLEYVNSRVAGYKKLRGITWIKSLPKSCVFNADSVSGKILKRDLRASFT